jgi:hypothetical protein
MRLTLCWWLLLVRVRGKAVQSSVDVNGPTFLLQNFSGTALLVRSFKHWRLCGRLSFTVLNIISSHRLFPYVIVCLLQMFYYCSTSK